jgi:hypothetical protein
VDARPRSRLLPGEAFYNAQAGALAGDACVTQADLGVLLSAFGGASP